MTKANGKNPQGVQINQEALDNQQHGMLRTLQILLSEEKVLYNRLRNCHWDVTEANFDALHTVFEDQFNKIADMTDEIAERIRQYGTHIPGTMHEFMQKVHLSDAPGVSPDAEVMGTNLVTDHAQMLRFVHGDIEIVDHKSKVGDLLISLLQQHEKMTWMLRMPIQAQITADKK